MIQIDMREARKEVRELVEKSAQVLKQGFWSEKVAERKEDGDIVSEFDRQVDKILVEGLKERFPNVGVISEESGESKQEELNWVIDPIDGSSHFLKGNPIFCISVALQKEDQPLLGVVCKPMMNMYYEAAVGQGAWLNEVRLRISNIDKLASSHIFLEFPEEKFEGESLTSDEFAWRMKAVGKLTKACSNIEHHHTGSWGLALAAAGAVEAYLDFSGTTKPWDVAAGILLVKEAGGDVMMMERDGKAIGLAAGSRAILQKVAEKLGIKLRGLDNDN